MISSHSEGASRPGLLRRQKLVRSSVVLVALGLGLFIGWRCSRGLELQHRDGAPSFDRLLALMFTILATVSGGELLRVSADRRRWLAASLMALVVLNAQASGAPTAPLAIAAGFWGTLLYACATRERRWALWSAWLCGTVLAGALLLRLATPT